MARTQDAARKLLNDWTDRAAYASVSQDFGITSPEQAYAVQLALQQLHTPGRGAIAGRKIALASKTMQQMIGYDQPISGAVFAGDVLASPATVRADDFIRLGVEFELAIELNADLPPQTAAHTPGSVVRHIAAVRPAFELIEDRAADYADLDPLTLISDNAWCGGVVLGPQVPDWAALDLGDIRSVVSQPGQPDEETNTGAADPLGSLAWVLNHFSARGLTLTKGEIVITGSAVRTRFPAPGDRLRYDVAGSVVQMDVV